MIPLFKVFMSEDVLKPVSDLLMSGYIGQGNKVDEFEKLLGEHIGNPHINTVNSATSGLHLAIRLADCWPDSEILTTPLTCFATNAPILANGCQVRWVDIDPKTCGMDLDDLERKLSPNTRAIMVVHWGGYPVDLDRLKSIQNKCYALYGHIPAIIEDCAHAWGATYKEKRLGNHGNTCVFSFQAIKHFTTVDGGCIVHRSESQWERGKLLRWYGLDRTKSADYRCEQNISESGFKFHMNDLNATIGIHNLPHVDKLVEVNQLNGKFYDEELKGVNGVKIMEHKKDRQSAYWIYTIRIKNRDNFIKMMTEKGIAVSRVHNRNDEHSCMSKFRCALPNLDEVCKDMICLYGESPILLASGKTKLIRDIVKNKLKVNVLSFNEKTKKIEVKKICGWYKNKIRDRKWARICLKNNTENGGTYSKRKGVWVTEDHLVLTDGGYKEATNIKENLVATGEKSLNNMQKSFLVGTMLGDSCIEKRRFIVSHTAVHEDYLDLKHKCLREFGVNKRKIDKKGRTKESFVLKSKDAMEWNYFYRYFYKNGIKIIPQNLEDYFNELTLATLYMDDGNRQNNVITLCTECFSEDENNRLSNLINSKFNITSRVVDYKKSTRIKIGNGNNHHNSANAFFEIVAPYIVRSFDYKLPEKIRDSIPFDKKLWDLGKAEAFYGDVETKIGTPRKDYDVKSVYCIDVEDNHNFICNNIVLHNCIPCGWWVSSEDREYIVEGIKQGW